MAARLGAGNTPKFAHVAHVFLPTTKPIDLALADPTNRKSLTDRVRGKSLTDRVCGKSLTDRVCGKSLTDRVRVEKSH